MFAWSTLTAFVVASIAIILAPGLAQALVLATTLNEGRRSGFMTAVGLNVGTLIHAVAAALGLSAVLMTSALAFSIVKFVGAVYLIYLGLRAVWESRTTDYVADRGTPATTSFVKAVLTAKRCSPGCSIQRWRCSFSPSCRNSSTRAAARSSGNSWGSAPCWPSWTCSTRRC